MLVAFPSPFIPLSKLPYLTRHVRTPSAVMRDRRTRWDLPNIRSAYCAATQSRWLLIALRPDYAGARTSSEHLRFLDGQTQERIRIQYEWNLPCPPERTESTFPSVCESSRSKSSGFRCRVLFDGSHTDASGLGDSENLQLGLFSRTSVTLRVAHKTLLGTENVARLRCTNMRYESARNEARLNAEKAHTFSVIRRVVWYR